MLKMFQYFIYLLTISNYSIVKCCLFQFSDSLFLRSHSSGIIDRLLKKYFPKSEMCRTDADPETKVESMGLGELSVIFIIYCFGFALSILFLVGEFIFGLQKYHNKNNNTRSIWANQGNLLAWKFKAEKDWDPSERVYTFLRKNWINTIWPIKTVVPEVGRHKWSPRNWISIYRLTERSFPKISRFQLMCCSRTICAVNSKFDPPPFSCYKV